MFCLIACTVQKRTFNKGYFVQWNFKHKKVEKVNKTNDVSQSELEDTFVNLIESSEVNLTIPLENLERHQHGDAVELSNKAEIPEKTHTLKAYKTKFNQDLHKLSKEPNFKKKYKNKRNWHIVFLTMKIAFLSWFTVLIFIEDFIWPALIIHFFVLHLIALGILKIIIYHKLYKFKKDLNNNVNNLPSENEIKENFKRGKKIISIIFGIVYIVFIGVILSLA